jgi:crotonobetainyl-CoA:carnitine CoA-transferase CaiB-like acyl-CoA transferase
MGRPKLATDARFATLADRKANEDDLDAEVTAWTITRDPFNAMRDLQAAGVAAYPPQMNKELDADPHLNARNIFVEKEHAHPEVGVRRHVGIPWRMSDTPCEVWRAAPVMGQDNDYVFGELLGYTSAQIADLVAREVIH